MTGYSRSVGTGANLPAKTLINAGRQHIRYDLAVVGLLAATGDDLSEMANAELDPRTAAEQHVQVCRADNPGAHERTGH